MKINLFYLSANTTGGWVTYTYHLIEALKAAGHEPVLRKLGNRTERNPRPFGYEQEYINTSTIDAIQSLEKEVGLIVAISKNYKEITNILLTHGAKIVIHDPTELRNVDKELLEACSPIVIRKVGLKTIPYATFIPHPYKARNEPIPEKTVLAVSTSRIDFDKHTNLLLDANRLLPDDKKIKIYGFENRLYTRFNIVPKYPEWEQSKVAYERSSYAAFNILKDSKFMVDMSIIKGDGGGTQYTTLEAWDASCIPIIHTNWYIPGDEMDANYNCLIVNSGEGIASVLRYNIDEPFLNNILLNCKKSLQTHDHRLIGQQYSQLLFGK